MAAAIAVSSSALGTPRPGREFFARPTERVARDLLGMTLVHRSAGGTVGGVVVEVEAYLGTGDAAAHSSAGITPRTRVIFGPPGHAYVFMAYGLHCCLNVVAEPAGRPGCVLVRALEPTIGVGLMRARRPRGAASEMLASGPGRLTKAMGVDMRLNGSDLVTGPLSLHPAADPARPAVTTATRVGISRARHLALRFYVTDNRFVSRPWR